MRGMVAHPKRPPQDRRHSPGRPDGTDKPVCFGSFCQQRRDLGPLLGRQPCLPAATRLGPERRSPTAGPSPCKPLAHGARRDAQRLSDAPPRPTRLVWFPRPQPSAFPPVSWSICVVHVARCTISPPHRLDCSAAVSKDYSLYSHDAATDRGSIRIPEPTATGGSENDDREAPRHLSELIAEPVPGSLVVPDARQHLEVRLGPGQQPPHS
jgi:hypothetical protein